MLSNIQLEIYYIFFFIFLVLLQKYVATVDFIFSGNTSYLSLIQVQVKIFRNFIFVFCLAQTYVALVDFLLSYFICTFYWYWYYELSFLLLNWIIRFTDNTMHLSFHLFHNINVFCSFLIFFLLTYIKFLRFLLFHCFLIFCRITFYFFIVF